MDFKSKKIAILGFGMEGQSVADFLVGKADSIAVLDEKNGTDFESEAIKGYEGRGIKFIWGRIADLKGFDIVFRSPGFKPTSKYILEAKDSGIEVTSATKLFFDLCPGEIIGVTGTKGKGTTSTLIYEMLKEAGEDAYLGGNIGVPPLSFLEKLDKDSKVVLELSSFQLMDMEKSPHIAVMLMVTSEHLDYHKDTYEYINAKRNIFRFQTKEDSAIVNQDYPASNESDIEGEGQTYKVSRESEVFDQGCFVKNGKMIIKMKGKEKEIFDMSDLALPGKHNWENACAASLAALIAGVDMDSITSVLKTFKGLSHRIESVATIRGVRYYDDSFSTTPETAIAAIESFSDPKVIILGGSSKNSDFSELGDIISSSNSIKAIIGIGDEWPRIREKLRVENRELRIIEDCKSMQEVVEKASEIAEIGDVVLLSPACASFGMFKNYKDRGNKFQEEVRRLTN